MKKKVKTKPRRRSGRSDALLPREAKFIEIFLRTGNQSQAAREAGYRGIKERMDAGWLTGHRLTGNWNA